MRYLFLAFLFLVVGIVAIAGFRGGLSRRPPIELFPDMDRQPKLRPQTGNKFYADGLSSQLPPPGTVARGSAWQNNEFNTGKVPGTTNYVDILPVAVTGELLKRGRERYTIYCAPCHGAGADGKGITTRQPYAMPYVANLHDPRIVRMPDGQIFHTITYGSPAQLMLGYGGQVPIADRWAIVSYVRTLQRARLGTREDVPSEVLAELLKPLPPAAVTNK